MTELNKCEITLIHTDVVADIKPKLMQLQGLAELYRAFSDETRCKILYALSLHELCVCDISELLEISQSSTSHHLRLLRMSRLVKSRKEGRQVFYSLDDAHVQMIIEMGIEHLKHA